jgi:hypothetical protein
MEVLRTSLPSSLAALEFAWTTFISNWRTRPDISIEPADILVVEDADGRDIPVIIDGESINVGRKVEVTFMEEAATCLVANSRSRNEE